MCLSGLATAQGTIRLKFPGEAKRVVWIDNPSKGFVGTKVNTSSLSLDLPYAAPQLGDRVNVADQTSGNLYTKPVAKLKPDGARGAGESTAPVLWILVPADATGVLKARVQVTYNGSGVAAANVKAKDSLREQSLLLTPSDKGKVEFEGVGFGMVRVRVEYKTEKGNQTSTEQTFELKAQRDEAIPVFTVNVPDKVATVGAVTDSPEPEPEARTLKPSSSPMQILLVLAGVVLGLGLLGLGLMLAKKHPEQLQDGLKKMGVRVPDPGDPADADPSTPIPHQPEPMKPIVLDDPGASDIHSVTAAPVGAVYSPRIVLGAGSQIDIPEGTLVVGREPGLGVSLTGETTVSRHHAEIVRQGNDVILRDLGSTNGTFVNGIQLDGEPRRLSAGDSVQFGAVQTRYEA